MKSVVLLSFLSFALCSIQQESTAKAFEEYSKIYPSTTNETFAEIATFISRVETAEDNELLTEYQMPLAKFLKLCFCFESPDSLNLQEFLDFLNLLDSLHGSAYLVAIFKMKSLVNSFGKVFSIDDLKYFATQNCKYFEVF